MELCGGTLTVEDPDELLVEYVEGYAGAAYDALETNGSSRLVTGDLLAPALLDVHVDPARYSVLRAMLPALSAGLDALPACSLGDATDADVELVAALFSVLDERGYQGSGVRGTIVSKVLHRKRPDLVPLYDSRIWTAYAVVGPIPRAERSWVEFMRLLCREMRGDLRREADAFVRLGALAAEHGAALTPLRILDILVWMSTHSPV